MFDIGWSEMLVILVVALIVIGPKDLPRVARSVGRWVAKGRAMAREFQDAIEDMAREAELDKVKKEIEKVGRTDIGKSIERTVDPGGELGKAFDPAADGASKASKAKSTGAGEARPASLKAEPVEPAEARTGASPPAEPAASEPPAELKKPAKARPPRASRPNGQAAERDTVPAEPS
jgi:sec-independent protein translocase protein TatB